MAKNFKDLTEPEILALAITLEEEDGRIYGEFAQSVRETYPATAQMLDEMQAEESGHRASLIELYRHRFGEHIPLIRRQDVKGFVTRPAVWLVRPVGPKAVRSAIESMEGETRRFYNLAMAKTTDASTRKLLGDLAGLMDGSVSTLAPVFAAAFATGQSKDAFLVGMAASIGAGISMAFAEALSDDGLLTGRGSPVIRGLVTGLMTTAGGIGHTLPYLIADFKTATSVAVVVVSVELAVISWIRHHYMDTPLVRATLQVVLGGVLVFITGILIGKS